METQLPSPEKGAQPAPNIRPYLLWRNGCMINMPLGIVEVGLGPGDVVLDGVAANPSKGHSLLVFNPCLLWPNG